ncbi:MAG: NlpC/P60 family protein [Frankiaceae bacterium]
MKLSSLLRAPVRRVRGSARRALVAVAVAASGAGSIVGVASIAAPVASAHAATANKAAAVIRFELAQLGKPYQWGAEGPSSYDCSGLTSAAYRYAGISIPRVSRDQYRYLTHVRVRYAQPGDLIFYGTDPTRASSVYHVTTYLGNGMMLAAPHTGTVVQIQPMRTKNLMPYAARPAGRYSPPPIPVEVGETSNAVRVVQSRLRANGFDVPIDGAYGQQTWNAVHALQLRLGTPGSGLVGPNTWGFLVSHGTFARTP